MDRKPADHAIWKKSAAIQFTLKDSTPLKLKSRDGREYFGTSKGCIFVTAAAALSEGDKKYNWDKKVTLALDEHEVPKLMLALKGVDTSFVHDPKMGSPDQGKIIRTMKVSKGETSKGDTVTFINLMEKVEGEENKIPGIALTQSEAMGIYILLESAMPKLVGWNQ